MGSSGCAILCRRLHLLRLSCFLDSSAPSSTLDAPGSTLAALCSLDPLKFPLFLYEVGEFQERVLSTFCWVIGRPECCWLVQFPISFLIMSCGNGCGCCPKCGCRATCTCNQSMYFDEDAVDISFSSTKMVGSNNSDCPNDGEPWASGVNDIGYLPGAYFADNAGEYMD